MRTIIPADALVSHTDRSLAFTPDGHSLAFISSDARQIFVRPLERARAGSHPDDCGLHQGNVPVSRWPVVWLHREQLRLEEDSIRGGAPVTVVLFDGPSRGVAWGPDDTIVFSTGARDTGLQRVASNGGPVNVLTRPDGKRGEDDHVQPAWLPGGRKLLFTIRPDTRGSRRRKESRFSTWPPAPRIRCSREATPRATSRAATLCMPRLAVMGNAI